MKSSAMRLASKGGVRPRGFRSVADAEAGYKRPPGRCALTDDLVLHTHPMSRGRIVRWMLEEVGHPYETRPMHFGAEMKSAEYLSINPMGKVPALVHGGRIVTEVAAICAYLADAFPEAGLAPPPPERDAYYRWLFFAAGPFEAAVVNGVLGVTVTPERRGMVGYGSLAAVLDTVEAALDGR